MYNLQIVGQLWLFSSLCFARLVVHDSSFQPDIILRAQSADVPVACTHRKSVVINGTAPGPLVLLKEGQTTWIRVYNDMHHSNLTVHWHGLSQSTAPFSDGTPLASQWPIAPLHFFDYELHPNIGEAGTYFYHSHVQFQAVTASGPIVVEEADEKPPYEYDEDRIFFLSELYRRSDANIVQGLINTTFEWSGEPKTLLLNGHAPPTPDAKKTNSCGPEIIEVEPDKTYRLRFIGGEALSDVGTAIEDHRDLQVIEADGSYTKAAMTDHIQADSGQRFSALLKTKSEAELKKLGKKEFWIQLNNMYRPTEVISFGLLRYTAKNSCHGFSCYKPGVAAKLPKNVPSIPKKKILSSPRFDNNWLEYTLEPLKPNDFPTADEVTRRIYLNNVQIETKAGRSLWLISNHTWVGKSTGPNYMTNPEQTPYLVSIYEHGEKAIPSVQRASKYGGWDPDFHAYPAKVGEVLEIILVNEAGFANSYDVHPWHAHGGHYYDIGAGKGVYDPVENEKKLKGYNPVLRDTTILYRYPPNNKVNDTEYFKDAWRGWRLRVQDAGVWMIHCHTLQHMIMGMQTTWIMGNASEIKSRGLPTMSHFDVFGKNDVGSDSKGYLSYKGEAYGNAERWPIVNHHFPEKSDTKRRN